MCVLICKPHNITISEDVLRGVFHRNSDGIGLGWSDGSSLSVWKTMKDIDEAVARLKALHKFPVLLHFRYATHGTVSMDNVHPFWMDERRRTLMAHNGVIQIPAAAGESDSRSFSRNVLSQLRDGWWYNSTTVTMVERLMSSSRIAMLEDSGSFHILNQRDGEVSADGVWFSNSAWRDHTKDKHRIPSQLLAETGEAKPYVNATPYRAPVTSPQSQAALPPVRPISDVIDNAVTRHDHSARHRNNDWPDYQNERSNSVVSRAIPVTDTEMAEWSAMYGTDFFGLAVAAIILPNGPFSEVTKFKCLDCMTSQDWKQKDIVPMDPVSLLDEELKYAKCCDCTRHLSFVARELFADPDLDDIDEPPVAPPAKIDRRRGKRQPRAVNHRP